MSDPCKRPNALEPGMSKLIWAQFSSQPVCNRNARPRHSCPCALVFLNSSKVLSEKQIGKRAHEPVYTLYLTSQKQDCYTQHDNCSSLLSKRTIVPDLYTGLAIYITSERTYQIAKINSSRRSSLSSLHILQSCPASPDPEWAVDKVPRYDEPLKLNINRTERTTILKPS